MSPIPDDPRGPTRLGARTSLTAEDRFARVVDAAPTALLLINPAGVIELANHQAERIFGYDPKQLQGGQLDTLLPERYRAAHVSLLTHFMTERSTRIMGESRDLFALRKDGSEFPVEIGLNPIDLDGQPMVLAGIIDISARRDAELRRERQRLELERSNADLDAFAYIASHDLKAPLRAVAHLAQWIEDDVREVAGPETFDYLRLMRGRVSRLQTLLDGLLAYSRIGRADSVVEQIAVAELVDDVVSLIAPPPGFSIVRDVAVTSLRSHRAPLRQVLMNLIDNAMKHHDRAEGQITISARRVDGDVEFRVTDDGPGIEPRFHNRIFLIFQTLAPRDDVETGGVGLAIVRKWVEQHGGRIWVESARPTRGTTFAFTWKPAGS